MSQYDLTIGDFNRYRHLEFSLGDDTFSGNICYMQAGEDLLQWDLCYMYTDEKWYKTDANDVAKMPGVVLATEALSADDYGIFLLYGFVRNDGWAAWTVGGILYASGTAGEMTQTQPAVAGDQVQVVGIALSAYKILFNPSYELVEIG